MNAPFHLESFEEGSNEVLWAELDILHVVTGEFRIASGHPSICGVARVIETPLGEALAVCTRQPNHALPPKCRGRHSWEQ